MHIVQNISNFVQFVGSVDGIPWVYKVEISTDLKESVSTHDISRSSVEGEVLTPLVPVVGISVQFDDVLHDDKAVVHLQLIHRQHFPISLSFFLHSHLQNLPDLERIVLCRKG